MRKRISQLLCVCAINAIMIACAKPAEDPPPPVSASSLVNTSHLDYLYTPFTFSNGTKAAGIYIYADAPDYHLVEASGEGFACVDDVARAVQVYFRSSKFLSDTAVQTKAYNLITFILEMQSPNGYFYNFVFSNGLINTGGATSINNPEWWSWRALQTLTETAPVIKNMNPSLYSKMDAAINKLVDKIKADLVDLPQTTKVVNGITVPQWLPAGSATDQSALLILGLISWYEASGDAAIKTYIKKLADGIVMMQAGNATQYPYGCFLSWENTWHAYGNAQAFALLKAGIFLNDATYTGAAMNEVDNFYPWILQNGYKSSMLFSKSGNVFQLLSENDYAQIAYGIEPMVFAAIEAYKETGQDKYADIAGHLAAWFFGANVTGIDMYDPATGRCFDGISSPADVNHNSGAESTIEALLTIQNVESNPAVKAAMDKY